MFVKNLKLVNYRNYDKLELNFKNGINIFIGRNAQGKTNILESIFLSCMGRSHRTSKDKELIKWDKDNAYIKTEVVKNDGTHLIEIFLSRNERKKIRINGVFINKIGELMGNINGVIFSPEDLKLVKDGPIERRRFIDMELSQINPPYFYCLQQYNRILMQRNNLLKEISHNNSLMSTLFAWDKQLAENGTKIISCRKDFIKRLSKIAREIHLKISNKNEILNVNYKTDILGNDLKEIEQNFLSTLENNRYNDIRKGTTSEGPHKDDVVLKVNDVDVRSFGSQGQQRTVALSLKLSEIEIMKNSTGETPVLLLDDVMSELDEQRQKLLMESILQTQTIVTTTDIENIKQLTELNGAIYHVVNGNVEYLT